MITGSAGHSAASCSRTAKLDGIDDRGRDLLHVLVVRAVPREQLRLRLNPHEDVVELVSHLLGEADGGHALCRLDLPLQRPYGTRVRECDDGSGREAGLENRRASRFDGEQLARFRAEVIVEIRRRLAALVCERDQAFGLGTRLPIRLRVVNGGVDSGR